MSPFSLLAVGLILLTAGAELLVRGASRMAGRFGIPPLLIGLTVVAFGTSAPEVAVSVRAAVSGNGDVSIGNVVGSNVFNVLFILGVSALVAPLAVQRQLVRLDVPVLIVVSFLPLLLGLDLVLGVGDGVLLLVLGVTYTAVLAWLGLRREAGSSNNPARAAPPPPEEPPRAAPRSRTAGAVLRDLLLAAAGLALLVLGADWLVQGATTIARAAGISELVIGLTLVAAGTSLPELATSVVATVRGERDIAVGNVIGSNIFNVLIVLGVAGAVSGSGIAVAPGILAVDFPVMIGVALICLPIFFTGWSISRLEGAAFLLYYVLYVGYLGLHAADHPLQDEFRATVLGFVLPLTLAVAAASWVRSWSRARRR